MFSGNADKKHFRYWPAIAVAVVLLLAVIQIARVNKQRPTESRTTETYTPRGNLIQDNIRIAAGDFYSSRIDLNRRSKLTGTFRTDSVKSNVSVVVMDEPNFNNWKLNLGYTAVTETGYVPGGRVAPALAPGTYFLVIDNRRNDAPRYLRVEFNLE